MKFILVTGQFRSGTSAVAQVFQRLGVPMSIAPPLAPVTEYDWECMDVTMALQDIFPFDATSITSEMRTKFCDWFPLYLEARLDWSMGIKAASKEPLYAIGVKSPRLTPFAGDIIRIAKECGFHDVLTLHATREFADQQRSIIHRFGPVGMTDDIFRLNRIIGRPVLQGWSMSVDLDYLRKFPNRCACKFAKMIDVGMEWPTIEYAADVIEQGSSHAVRERQTT